MKRSIVKILSAVLAVLLLIPLSLAGCADTTDTPGEDGSETLGEVTYLDDLGNNIDLGQTTIKFLTRVEENVSNEITEEENIHEVVNDAVHARNLAVSERLNCTIDNSDQIIGGMDDEAAKKLKSLVSSGNGDYDIYVSNSYNSVMSAYNGYLVNLKRCSNLNLDKEYWSKGFNDSISVGEKQYLCTGSFSMAFYRYMFVTLFNKELFENSKVDAPYELVKNKEWTLAKQAELAEVFYKDLDGMSGASDGDQFGFVLSAGGNTCMTDGFWTACDLSVSAKDDDNNYVTSIDKQAFSDAMEAIIGLTKSAGSYVYKEDDKKMFKKFTDGEAAMVQLRLLSVENADFRNMGTYGVIPMAKRDTTQKEYYTHEQDQFLVYGLPNYLSEDRIQTVGTFLEAFASESYVTVKPAYYEIALTAKYVNDQDSVDMLDIIAKGVKFDASSIYFNLFSFNCVALRTMIASGDPSISGKLSSYEKVIGRAIDKVNNAYDKIKS